MCRLHDVRHAYFTHLAESGEAPLTMSARAGHATVAMTLDRYCHATDAADAALVERQAARRAARAGTTIG
jgi:integrase